MSFWQEEVIQPALNNDVAAAVADQYSILAKDPNNSHAYFVLGTLSHFQGEVEQAILHFQKSIALDPRSAAPHLSLGRICAVRGEYNLAWEHARAAEALGSSELVVMLQRYPNLR